MKTMLEPMPTDSKTTVENPILCLAGKTRYLPANRPNTTRYRFGA